jgi:hypothetical protein
MNAQPKRKRLLHKIAASHAHANESLAKQPIISPMRVNCRKPDLITAQEVDSLYLGEGVATAATVEEIWHWHAASNAAHKANPATICSAVC